MYTATSGQVVGCPEILILIAGTTKKEQESIVAVF